MRKRSIAAILGLILGLGALLGCLGFYRNEVLTWFVKNIDWVENN